jgi:hypothetical protein
MMTFVYTDGLTAAIRTCSKDDVDLAIPDAMGRNGEVSVTHIRKKAFYGNHKILSVTFPSSLINIEESAFYNCTGLTSIVFSESLNVIGDDAFYGRRYRNRMKIAVTKCSVTNVN